MNAPNRKERRANIKKYRRTKITSVINARNFLSQHGCSEEKMSDEQVKDALKLFYGININLTGGIK